MRGDVKSVILPGYSRYEIFDTGIVKYRATGKICPHYGDGKDGYRKIKIYPDGSKKRKSFFMSRLVYEAFHGPIPPEMQIDHLDGHRINNKLDNLMLVTRKQNAVLKKQRDSRYLFNCKKTESKRIKVK